jgi:hypothetical protein
MGDDVGWFIIGACNQGGARATLRTSFDLADISNSA